MQTTTVNAADLVVFMLDVHLWGGRQALRREQLIAANPTLQGLPPQELASMGSIHICDPDEIRKFSRIKRAAQMAISDYGLPFLGAFAVPIAYYQKVHDRLVELRMEFEAAVRDLEQRYNGAATAWQAKWKMQNPAYQSLLARVPSAQEVAGRLSFAFHCFKVNAPSDNLDDSARQGFDTQVTGLKGELLSEVATEAQLLLEQYMVERKENGTTEQRSSITRKTLRPLQRVARKLETFAFLDTSVKPLTELVQKVLDGLPAEGPIEGGDLMLVWTLATALGNPATASHVAMVASNMGLDAAVKALPQVAKASKADQKPPQEVDIERPTDLTGGSPTAADQLANALLEGGDDSGLAVLFDDAAPSPVAPLDASPEDAQTGVPGAVGNTSVVDLLFDDGPVAPKGGAASNGDNFASDFF